MQENKPTKSKSTTVVQAPVTSKSYKLLVFSAFHTTGSVNRMLHRLNGVSTLSMPLL